MRSNLNRFRWTLVAACLGIAISVAALQARAQGYVVTNLVSDQPGVALVQDPNLVNAWGITASSTESFLGG